MAYNHKNKLAKVKQVKEEYNKHSKLHLSQKHIYETYIYPKFKIARSTFFRYLKIDTRHI